MQKLNYIFSISLSFSLLSCFGLFDSGSDEIIDNYNVTWVDTHETRALCKNQEVVVSEYVFGIGHDEDYIFAKQYEVLDKQKQTLDTSRVNYFIVTKTQNYYQDKPIYGPFNNIQFIAKCKELKIKNVKFDLEYPTDLSWE